MNQVAPVHVNIFSIRVLHLRDIIVLTGILWILLGTIIFIKIKFMDSVLNIDMINCKIGDLISSCYEFGRHFLLKKL